MEAVKTELSGRPGEGSRERIYGRRTWGDSPQVPAYPQDGARYPNTKTLAPPQGCALLAIPRRLWDEQIGIETCLNCQLDECNGGTR